MRTIRRLYLYLISFISLEVVVWGMIGLARFILGGDLIGSRVSQLASGLALTAVGVPVFLLHWWLVGRTLKNDEEHFSRLRAVFLYGALLTTLIPIIQNLLAFANRTWLLILQLPLRLVFIGEGQTWIDNIVAILVNGFIAVYIASVLRKDWSIIPEDASPSQGIFKETRRLYRYIWLLYGLALVVGGVQQVLYFTLNQLEPVGLGGGVSLANGLSLLVVGTPLWLNAWRVVKQSMADQDEVRSALRLVILYGVSFIGLGGVLVPAGLILNLVFRLIFGETMNLAGFLAEARGPLSAGIPFGVVWFYYGRTLTAEVAALPDTPRRAGLRRIYYYILSFVGLVTLFFGLHSLLAFIVDAALQTAAWIDSFRLRLAIALATLTIGLPLWILTWRPMAAEAAQTGEAGDHTRRSLVRKTYLYLVIFAGVIGVMFSGGSLIYQTSSKILGEPATNFQRTVWMLVEILGLFAGFLTYHLVILGADGRKAAQSLAERHKAFPVLVLATELGDFSEGILESIQRECPSLPVAVHLIEQSIPNEALSEAKAVILPGELSVEPMEAVRLWLRGFPGIRLIVPTETEGWLWVFGSGRGISSLTDRTAKLIRHLAEGEELPKTRETSLLNTVVTILVGIVSIPLLIGFFTALGDLLD